METFDIELLAACFEARRRQREMLPLIATALDVLDNEVFYTWAVRRCAQSGAIADGPWRLRFHGLECDLMNAADGRFLRYDFGPGGTVDCVTPWGVLQFVMTATEPWQPFPSLRGHLARHSPPHDRLSGDHTKVTEIWDRLELAGCFAPASPSLAAFLTQHTFVGPDGINHVSFPEGTSDETVADCLVARRPVLTARASELLEAGITNHRT